MLGEDLVDARRPDTGPHALDPDAAYRLAEIGDLDELLFSARAKRDRAHGRAVTYSRKIFLPLTHLCRDVCHYCTFAKTPARLDRPYMAVDEILRIAERGRALGCKEALFTLGEKPELRYRAAREALREKGFASTLHYVAHLAGKVVEETGLLPHINAGNLTADDIEMLRPVSASMGLMLESSAERLARRGMPHFGSPDKAPSTRLATIKNAGEARVPFTTGILIGIGETRHEIIHSLLQLRELHHRYGHIQEIIVQNFRAKPGTRMANAPEPSIDDLCWAIASARMIFDPDMNIQAPPNLSAGEMGRILAAGANDWGGVSPLTPDFVNPEAPWPEIDVLNKQTAIAGGLLQERMTIYPGYVLDAETWLDRAMTRHVLRLSDSQGYAREDSWHAGAGASPPAADLGLLNSARRPVTGTRLNTILARASDGRELSESDIVHLLSARGDDFSEVCATADKVRRTICGDVVTYAVNRNINYTNICYYKCRFCAFSKGKRSENLAGKPYDLPLEEIQRRSVEAWERGATEVCLQGGIHPRFTGETYLSICRAIKCAVPRIHIHAFSPLEIWQGAATMGLPLATYLARLKQAGLGSMPGTAAEILDDEVRATLCPDKISTAQWLEVVATAHRAGLPTTATIMFGHTERLVHVARHMLHIRTLQKATGGITEFVPLPFVAEQSPIYLKGQARGGPTFREAVLVHAVARLVLHPHVKNIQASWVKLGSEGVSACLDAGVNDIGGTLMNESISRAAGASHGQEMTPSEMEALIRRCGRMPMQRRTDYSLNAG